MERIQSAQTFAAKIGKKIDLAGQVCFNSDIQIINRNYYMSINGLPKNLICLISSFLDKESLHSFGSTNKKHNNIIFKDPQTVHAIWCRHLNLLEKSLPQKIKEKEDKERTFEILKFRSDVKRVFLEEEKLACELQWIKHFIRNNLHDYGAAQCEKRRFDDWFTKSERQLLENLNQCMVLGKFDETRLLELEYHVEGLKKFDDRHVFLISYCVLTGKTSFEKLILASSIYSEYQIKDLIILFQVTQIQIKKLLIECFSEPEIIFKKSRLVKFLIRCLPSKDQKEFLQLFAKIRNEKMKKSYILEEIFFADDFLHEGFEIDINLLEEILQNFAVYDRLIDFFYKNTHLTISELISRIENSRTFLEFGAGQTSFIKKLIKKYLAQENKDPEDVKKLLRVLIRRNEGSQEHIGLLFASVTLDQKFLICEESTKELIKELITDLNLACNRRLVFLSLLLKSARLDEKFSISKIEINEYRELFEKNRGLWVSPKYENSLPSKQLSAEECQKQMMALLKNNLL